MRLTRQIRGCKPPSVAANPSPAERTVVTAPSPPGEPPQAVAEAANVPSSGAVSAASLMKQASVRRPPSDDDDDDDADDDGMAEQKPSGGVSAMRGKLGNLNLGAMLPGAAPPPRSQPQYQAPRRMTAAAPAPRSLPRQGASHLRTMA